jgi:molecular chaperone GrpE (heat shock protein)
MIAIYGNNVEDEREALAARLKVLEKNTAAKDKQVSKLQECFSIAQRHFKNLRKGFKALNQASHASAIAKSSPQLLDETCDEEMPSLESS